MSIETLKRKSSKEEEMEPKKTKISNEAVPCTILMKFNNHFPGTPEVFTQDGPVHKANFHCELTINNRKFTGSGNTKKKAKQEAAESAIKELIPSALLDIDVPMDQGDNSDFIKEAKLKKANRKNDNTLSTAIETKPKFVKPPGKSATAILHAIWPLIQIKITEQVANKAVEKVVANKETIEGQVDEIKPVVPPPEYVAELLMDGKIYKESAASTKAVKSKLAGKVLTLKFGMKFTYAPDGSAYYEGADVDWERYKSKVEVVPSPAVCRGKNPVQFLKELYPAATFEQDAKSKEQLLELGVSNYAISIEIENKTYKVEASNKKVAKAKCAVLAIQGLQKEGLLAPKLEERKIQATNKKLQAAKYMARKNMGFGYTEPYSSNGNSNLASNVIRLAVHFPNIQYELVSQEPSPVNGQTIFGIGTTVQGEYFIGTGETVVVARENVAGIVLKKFGLANEPPPQKVFYNKWNNNNSKPGGDVYLGATKKPFFNVPNKANFGQKSQKILPYFTNFQKSQEVVGASNQPPIYYEENGITLQSNNNNGVMVNEGGYMMDGSGQAYKQDEYYGQGVGWNNTQSTNKRIIQGSANASNAQTQKPRGPYTPIVKQQQQDNRALGKQQLQERALIGSGSNLIDRQAGGYQSGGQMAGFGEEDTAYMNAYETGATLQIQPGVGYEYQTTYGTKEPASARYQGIDSRSANQLYSTNSRSGGTLSAQGQGGGAYATLGASQIVTGGGITGGRLGGYVANAMVTDQEEEYKYIAAANSAYQQQQQSAAAAAYGANAKFFNFYPA